MSDGRIVYEVRVDSSKVGEDLKTSYAQVSAGTESLKKLAAGAAEEIGVVLSAISDLNQNAGTAIGNVSALRSTFEGVKNIISSVTEKISGFTGLDLSKSNDTAITNTASTSNLQKSVANVKAEAKMAAKGIMPLAVGLDYVPYDNFPALLHKGEAVLTASENAARNTAGNSLGFAQPAKSQNKLNIPEDFIKDLRKSQTAVFSIKMGEYEIARQVTSTANELSRQLGIKIIQ